jgi:hypothetical protein
MGYWQLRRYWSGVTLPYTWLNPSTRPRTRRPGRKGMAKRKGLPTGLGWPTTGNARSLASAALVVLLTLISTIDAAETNICKVSANPTGFDHQQITLEGIVAGLTKSTSRSGRKDMTFLLRSPVGCGGVIVYAQEPATLSNGDHVTTFPSARGLWRISQRAMHGRAGLSLRHSPRPRSASGRLAESFTLIHDAAGTVEESELAKIAVEHQPRGIGEAAPATLKMLATLSGAATAGSFALFLISSARRLRFRDANSRIERTHDSVHRPPPPSM